MVAITYSYFLIFAQFAFLKRLAQFHILDAQLKGVMAAMAFGGILFSLLAPRSTFLSGARVRLQLALTVAALAALLTLLQLNLTVAVAIAFLIGSSLGMLTVTLVTHVGLWIGSTNPLLKLGLGTGLGYFICNFPPLFNASAQVQALTAGSLCLSAVFVASVAEPQPLVEIGETTAVAVTASPSFYLVLLAFTALIWLDSAAFFIIQSTPPLKAGTWQGTAHLYLNSVLHLFAALLSALLIRRRGLATTLCFAFLALATACLLLLDPHRDLLASLFYPVGVSLYSVALVAYPAFLSGTTTTAERGRRAGWIYAVGGWFGSAMGIGMGQNLGHIPPFFVIAAAALIVLPALLQTRRRELLATTTVLLAAGAAWAMKKNFTPTPTPIAPVELGRQVYIAEGCINCHSQYVRPNTPDVLLWGPVQTLTDLRAQRPPLIGNRRQGPDLSEVAERRSPLWLRAHFFQPSQISHGSIMPAFASLFRTQHGDDLLAYIETLRPSTPAAARHRAAELAWKPGPGALAAGNPSYGAMLYNQECATCHAANGATRIEWRTSFHRLPTMLSTGPYFHLSAAATPAERQTQLAQIIKFGIPNTDMAGHEYLSDADVASLTAYVQQLIPQQPYAATNTPHGAIR